jgi:hypothetical protein
MDVPDPSDTVYQDTDRWRELSHAAGERMEAPSRVVRFSRKLLVAGALFLIVVTMCDVL